MIGGLVHYEEDLGLIALFHALQEVDQLHVVQCNYEMSTGNATGCAIPHHHPYDFCPQHRSGKYTREKESCHCRLPTSSV
jgi:hypothetical protein